MGAWGYGSYENDDAADWLITVAETVSKLVTKQLKPKGTHYRYNGNVAAAQLLVDQPSRVRYQIMEETWELADLRVQEAIDDGTWLNSWNKPEVKTAEVKALRRAIHTAWNDRKDATDRTSRLFKKRILKRKPTKRKAQADGK